MRITERFRSEHIARADDVLSPMAERILDEVELVALDDSTVGAPA